jgi:hypothetical protein
MAQTVPRSTSLRTEHCDGCAEAEQMLLRLRGHNLAMVGRIEDFLGIARTSHEAGRRDVTTGDVRTRK